MNIFIYDNDIKLNAQYYPDSHNIKGGTNETVAL